MYDISKKDVRIMDFLRRSAIDNDGFGNAKFAAAITIKGRVISLGHNQQKTHPFQSRYGKNSEAIYLHAETSAISNCLNHMDKTDMEKATIYVQRVKRPPQRNTTKWVSGMAKPCKGCMRAIADFKLKRVVYSTDEDGGIAVHRRST
jgi:deoxycytidylate deaminase